MAVESKIKLGIAIAKIRNEYYYKHLIEFLKGDDKNCGSTYFYCLKPLYDKYGYETVNNVLLALDKEDAKNE